MSLRKFSAQGSLDPTNGWSRRYPPLLIMIVALVLAVFALPSALNLPQANPSQTLEYAPVPGDQGKAAPGGNFAGLGLGTGGLGAGSAGGGGSGPEAGAPPPPQQVLPGQGGSPSKYRCVGSPPRQTEDRLSPPCVAFFSGDNGGVTYKTGVTRDEIRTLFVIDGSSSVIRTSDGTEQTPCSGYFDMDKPAQGNEDVFRRALRLWQVYFNTRYQTYGRHVHFIVHYTDSGCSTGDPSAYAPDGRRAMAADNIRETHPFASFPYLASGDVSPYENAMAQQGVLGFGGNFLRTQSYFSSYPDLIWGFNPAVEQYAALYSDYVYRKVVPNPVSFSGNPGENTRPRKFGLIVVNDPNHPEMTAYGQAVQHRLEGCGAHFGSDVGTETTYGGGTDTAQQAAVFLAQFKRDGVTTVLRVGANVSITSGEAANLGYFPEWVLAGDNLEEGNESGSLQNQREWTNAWIVTPQLLFGRDGVDEPCGEAIREVNPGTPSLDYGWYCSFYGDLRQYFTGIQVGGPRLNPDAINQGFRAIPAHGSSSPGTPACFYPAGDFTCVKDAIVEWWDPGGGNAQSTTSGCWRAVEGGRRHLPGGWPPGNVTEQQDRAHDPCNTYFTGYV